MKTMHNNHQKSFVRGAVALLALLLLSACAPTHYRQVTLIEPSQSRPATEVYFYPQRGQLAQQQDRDRYECYLWAVQQSGFDPSAPQLAPHQQVVVRSAPADGQNTTVGAVAGALIGAAVSSRHNSARGAVLGAVTGALIGAASDEANRQQTQTVYSRYRTTSAAALEQGAENYRRAMKACLSGRGYSVR